MHEDKIRVTNPNTGRLREEIVATPLSQISEIVGAARESQPAWAATPFSERARLLRAIAGACGEQARDIALHIHEEMGKPLGQAEGEVRAYVSGIESSIEMMQKALVAEEQSFAGGKTSVHYIPLGVVAVITPWNFPFGMPWTLLVPSLLAGNSVVFKPSEISPRAGVEMAEIFNRYLPAGVLQTVTGAGQHGAALAEAEVDLIAFVGSRETGKRIMEVAARRATRLLLEMGGKDPMIVADDADLEQAARFAAIAANRNTGQVCVSVERVYVDKKVARPFLDKLREEVAKITVGPENAGEGDLNMGPLSSERQLAHVQQQLQAAVAAGATIDVGGQRLDRPGTWLEPTIVTGVDDEMAIMRDETFGPVICLREVDSLDQAIEKANHTRFGLGATLWSEDASKAEAIAVKIESGMVGVNRSFGGSDIGLWAGAKESGYGHTGGVSGMRNFLQPRTVTIRT